MEMNSGRRKGGDGRIRWRLLALLWIWAVLMFVTFDLFVNVPAFDRVRPPH